MRRRYWELGRETVLAWLSDDSDAGADVDLTAKLGRAFPRFDCAEGDAQAAAPDTWLLVMMLFCGSVFSVIAQTCRPENRPASGCGRTYTHTICTCTRLWLGSDYAKYHTGSTAPLSPLPAPAHAVGLLT